MQETIDGKKMDVLWVHAFASSAEENHGGRHNRLQTDLADKNIRVKIAACKQNHLTPKRALTKATLKDDRFLWIPGISRKRNIIFRLLNVFCFFILLLTSSRKKLGKVDIVIGSSPDPLAAWGGYLLSKRLAVPFVLEVRDVWPETLIKLQKYKPWHPYILFLEFLERRLISRAQLILSTLPGLESYVRSFRQKTKVLHVPNYVSQTDIVSLPLSPSPRKVMKIIYAGTMGVANDLTTFFEAMSLLEEQGLGDGFSVEVFGDGPLQAKIERKYAKLTSVTFFGRVNRARIMERLRMADIGIICWKKNDLYRHGISANKIADYFASGLPVAMSYDYTHALKNGLAGIRTPAEDPQALAEAILKMKNLSEEEFDEMRLAAVTLAKSEYCFQTFGDILQSHLQSLPR
jgi:glycosyltransferase involved in cell wall biosynthesis